MSDTDWRLSNEDWDAEFSIRADRMLDLYCKRLSDLGYEPVPYPDEHAHIGENVYKGGKYPVLNHALWMCGEARRFAREHRRAKAYRWIGMIQGLLWTGGIFSIDELKRHNELPPDMWRGPHRAE